MGSRRGLVAPQNTFLDNIVKRSNGQYVSFIIGNARIAEYPVVFANDGFCQLTGFSRPDIMKKSCTLKEMYHGSVLDTVCSDITNALKNEGCLNVEVPVIKQDKKILWLLMHIAPIRNEKDKVVLFLCSFKDITAQKVPLEEDDLKESPTNILVGLSKFAKLARSVRRPNGLATQNGSLPSPRSESTIHFAAEMGVNSRFLPQYRLEPPKTPAHIILHYSLFKTVWDWIILFFTFYTAAMVPYNVAFKYKTMDDVPLLVMDSIVDVVFFIDIILNFHTTFVGPSGEVISEAKTIRRNYLRTWFIVDLISCLPYDVFNAFQHQDDGISNLFSALKVVRLLRLGRVARKMDHYLEYGAAVLVLIVCMFVLISHWFACLWYHIGLTEVAKFPHNWLNTLANTIGKPYYDANGTRVDGGGVSREAAYITSLYYTLSCMTSVGFGNVNATTEIEKLFSCCMMIAGSLLYAAIFGNVTNIFQQIMSANAKYHEMVTSVRNFMKLHNVPKELSERVTDYLVSAWVITKGIDTDKVLSYCPKDMKADISVHLNSVVFKMTTAFRLASDGCLRALAVHFRIFHTAPGDLFYHQGESLDQLCFIVSGSLEVIQDDEVIGLLTKGDIFGDKFWSPRHTVGQSSANVRALTYCNIHMIKKDKLLYVLSFYQAFANSFKRNIELTVNLRDRWIFRKIEDVEREKQLEEDRKSQPPVDYNKPPMRNILSKFKKNLNGSTNQAFDAENGVSVSPVPVPTNCLSPVANGHARVPPPRSAKGNSRAGTLFNVGSPALDRGQSFVMTRRFSEIEATIIQSLSGIRVDLRQEIESLTDKLNSVDTRIELLMSQYDEEKEREQAEAEREAAEAASRKVVEAEENSALERMVVAVIEDETVSNSGSSSNMRKSEKNMATMGLDDAATADSPQNSLSPARHTSLHKSTSKDSSKSSSGDKSPKSGLTPIIRSPKIAPMPAIASAVPKVTGVKPVPPKATKPMGDKDFMNPTTASSSRTVRPGKDSSS